MNQACFITWLLYDIDSPLFQRRLDYYRDAVLPRLLKDDRADIAVWCYPHHEDKISALSPRIQTFQVDCTPVRLKGKWWQAHADWDKVHGLPQYKIQIGLDSDDLIAPGFLDKLFSVAKGNEPLHISFQPYVLDLSTGKCYHAKRVYSKEFGSPIFALYQPDPTNYRFAYFTEHTRLGRFFEHTIIVPEGYCTMTIHGSNDSSNISNHAGRPMPKSFKP